MKLIAMFFLVVATYSSSVLAESKTEIPQYTHPDAKTFCESLGKRLPSARELAQYAIERGAAGILEPKQYKNQDGYMPINKLVTNYTTELDFYYNPDGYVPTENDVKKAWLWSASYGPHNIDFVYVFNLKSGEFDFDARIMKNGARCIE